MRAAVHFRMPHINGSTKCKDNWNDSGEIDPMITHILKLEDINKGFDLMHSEEIIRSMVVC